MTNHLPPYPNILQAIGLTIINLGLLYLFTVVLFSLNGNILPPTAIFLVGYILSMSTSLYIGKGFRKNTLGALPIFFKQVDFKAVILLILATIAIDIGIVLPIADFIPISDFFKASMIQNFGNLDAFMFFAMIFGAPFFEEYLYRGIILGGLLKIYAPWLAILVSSLLFGAIHINPIQFVSATLGGLFLGWVYYKSRNLTYCAIIHLVINLTGFFIIRNIGIEQIFEEGFLELSGGTGNAVAIFIVALLVIFFSVSKLNQLLKIPNQ